MMKMRARRAWMTNEEKLQEALTLIKRHITEEETVQNREVHEAIQLIVDVVRQHGYCKK